MYRTQKRIQGTMMERDRRKRLGQFFTSTALGRLLGALGDAPRSGSIIDPMAGRGDLLTACKELGCSPSTFAAIEIDPIAHSKCRAEHTKTTCLLGSAFDPTVLARLPKREWDLVIGNPPYVRYQSMASGGDGVEVPNAVEVRNGLLSSLEGMSALDHEDKRLFKLLVSNYSGFADMAVPSWILCASLVAVGGRLALVVPESWLSREYASVVNYILLRWFRIEHIVEDEHAVWFADAQVKTLLLVAQRVERRDSAYEWGDTCFVRSRLSGLAAGACGPIIHLYPKQIAPERSFINDCEQVLKTGLSKQSALCTMKAERIGGMAALNASSAKGQKWLPLMGEPSSNATLTLQLPPRLAEWMPAGNTRSMVPLEELGVTVNQGLRTGANRFFYATEIKSTGTHTVVFPDGLPSMGPVSIPSVCLHPVIRKQSDLPVGFRIERKIISGRVLQLNRIALPEDIALNGALVKEAYGPMPEGLASFVRKAAQVDFGKDGQRKRIWELTAVAPNVRKGDSKKGVPPRFWYMLPDFAPRHRPDVIMPRINGTGPKAMLVADKGILIDANFVTFNVAKHTGVDAYALLAVLNSTWCKVALECSASVMGGGALKVEAAHLRKLPIPAFTLSEWGKLSEMGKVLSEKATGLERIDRLFANALTGKTVVGDSLAALNRLASEAQIRRDGHRARPMTATLELEYQ